MVILMHGNDAGLAALILTARLISFQSHLMNEDHLADFCFHFVYFKQVLEHENKPSYVDLFRRCTARVCVSNLFYSISSVGLD